MCHQTDCRKDKACKNNKCKDPCPGICGINPECIVSNHAPMCNCLPGHEGNPLASSTLPPPTSGKSDRINGGNEAADHKYPFMASIRIRGQHFCAGSLINERWILSAAHCFHSVGIADGITAQLGNNRLYSLWGYQQIQVVHIVKHEAFDMDRGFKNDIALLKLDKVASIGETVKPVLLSTDRLSTNFMVMVIGWGNTQPSTSTITISINLKELPQVAKEINTCSGTYDYLYKTQLCMWSISEGTGTCIGDSGGPLVTSHGVQVGIVSMGSVPCAQNLPTLYTDVSQYIEWIEEMLANDVKIA